jgi:hypothetical protein
MLRPRSAFGSVRDSRRSLRAVAHDAWQFLSLHSASAAVRCQRSAIDGTGLFLVRGVVAGQAIGRLALGRSIAQGKHTLLVGSRHRLVKKPWRFLNHACTPSAVLQLGSDAALLIAARDLPAGSELTIDYASLPETVSVQFACHCPSCQHSGANAPRSD